MNISFLFAYFICIPLVVGDVYLFGPKFNSTYLPNKNGDLNIKLSWSEDSIQPLIKDITHFTVSIVTGPIELVTPIKLLDANFTLLSGELISHGSGTKKSWDYNARLKDNETCDGNYFFQVISTIGDFKTYTIHYSDRFNLENMKTNKNKDVNHGANSIVPAPNLETTRAKVDPHVSEYYTIPYGEQTGIARYAPMINTVDLKTKKQRWFNQFPKTQLTTFKKIGKVTPTVQYTITQVNTYWFTTKTNSLMHQSNPTKWNAASERITQKPSRKREYLTSSFP